VRTVQAELYRANPITSFDTCAVKCELANGAATYFYATHADQNALGPIFHYEFTQGTITGEMAAPFVGRVAGKVRVYPRDPEINGHRNKLWQCLARCRGEGEAVCGIAAASETTRVVNAAHLSMPEIIAFPPETIVDYSHGENSSPAAPQKTVPGLLETLTQCYTQALLPSTHGAVTYARAGKIITLADLHHFSLPA
jgi:hypothetical protein